MSRYIGLEPGYAKEDKRFSEHTDCQCEHYGVTCEAHKVKYSVTETDVKSRLTAVTTECRSEL